MTARAHSRWARHFVGEEKIRSRMGPENPLDGDEAIEYEEDLLPNTLRRRRRTSRSLMTLLLCILILSGVAMIWRQSSSENVIIGETRWTGHVPGFMVFENLLYRDKVFYFSGTAGMPPDLADFTSHNVTLRHINTTDLILNPTVMRGSSIFLNDPSLHYYHFAGEEIFGAVAALSAATNDSQTVPDRLIFPWGPFKDKYGLNEPFAKAVWGRGLVRTEKWRGIENRGWVYFERVAIIDRKAAERSKPAWSWNKMAMDVLTRPHSPDFFEPVRKKYLAKKFIPIRIRNPSTSPQVGPVRVLYIDRQDTTRQFDQPSQMGLLKVLNELQAEGKIIWVHGKFGQMKVHDQIKASAEADIILGLHGNGLTHEMWMAPGGTVIEMFPPDTFIRDYQILAEAVGHTHYLIRNDTMIPRKEWEEFVGQRNAHTLKDGTISFLDEQFFSGFLRTVVSKQIRGQEV